MGAGGEQVDGLDAALDVVRASCRRAPKPARLMNRMEFLQEREEARFLGQPLERLGGRDFRDYLGECGGKLTVPELSYFLPRMCEVLASGDPIDPMIGWRGAFAFLKHSAFPDDWPDDRAAAMQAFCEALIVDFVADPERFSDGGNGFGVVLGSVLYGIAEGGVDLEGLLKALNRCDPDLLDQAVEVWKGSEFDGYTFGPDGHAILPEIGSLGPSRLAMVDEWLRSRNDRRARCGPRSSTLADGDRG